MRKSHQPLFFVVLLVIWLTMFLSQTHAQTGSSSTQCKALPPAGIWANLKAKNHELIRLEITRICRTDQKKKDSSLWEIRAYSRCMPRDCKWGREKAKMDAQGRLNVRFQTFSAERIVSLVQKENKIYADIKIRYRKKRKDDLQSLVFTRSDE